MTDMHIQPMSLVDAYRAVGWSCAAHMGREPEISWLLRTRLRYLIGRHVVGPLLYRYCMQGFKLVSRRSMLGFIMSRSGHHSAYIADIYLHPQYRLKGVGEFLVTQYARRMRDQGLRFVWGLVSARNRRALALARTLGFRRVFSSALQGPPAGLFTAANNGHDQGVARLRRYRRADECCLTNVAAPPTASCSLGHALALRTDVWPLLIRQGRSLTIADHEQPIGFVSLIDYPFAPLLISFLPPEYWGTSIEFQGLARLAAHCCQLRGMVTIQGCCPEHQEILLKRLKPCGFGKQTPVRLIILSSVEPLLQRPTTEAPVEG